MVYGVSVTVVICFVCCVLLFGDCSDDNCW